MVCTPDKSRFTVVAQEGDRELLIDYHSRVEVEGEAGALLHAAVHICSSGEWREQTIFEPTYLARRPETIARRLRELSEYDLTPQRVTG